MKIITVTENLMDVRCDDPVCLRFHQVFKDLDYLIDVRNGLLHRFGRSPSWGKVWGMITEEIPPLELALNQAIEDIEAAAPLWVPDHRAQLNIVRLGFQTHHRA